jgi:hypothetical protein
MDRIKQSTKSKSNQRGTKKESQVERSARTQPLREATPIQWQGKLRAAELEGLLSAYPDDESSVDEDLVLPDTEGLSDPYDEDDSSAPDGNDDFDKHEGEAFVAGCDSEQTGEVGDSAAMFTLKVDDSGICRLQIPSWFRYQESHPSGQEFVDEGHDLLATLEKIANWLTGHRSAFLKTADPWDLGADALEELKKGMPSITEGGFMKLAEIFDTQFNRHRRHAALVWSDAHMPLRFLFGDEAKCAWVANAIVQRRQNKKEPITEETLDKWATIKLPKKKADKNPIKGTRTDGSTPSELIQKACLIAGVTWDDVVERYRKNMLGAFQQL